MFTKETMSLYVPDDLQLDKEEHVYFGLPVLPSASRGNDTAQRTEQNHFSCHTLQLASTVISGCLRKEITKIIIHSLLKEKEKRE